MLGRGGFIWMPPLENWMLRFRSHLARSISRCLNNTNSNFAFHNSPGCMIHPNPALEIDSRFLILDSLDLMSQRHVPLLQVFFLDQPLRHGFRVANWTALAAREHRKTHDVEQTEKMTPLITCAASFGYQVSQLVYGVNIFDSDYGVQIDSVEQPIKSNSVGPGTRVSSSDFCL